MFILVDDGVLNIKRVTTIEIDRDTTSEINYLFNDGAIIKEKFDNEIEALAKFEVLTEENLFIKTNDNRLINAMYIKNIEKDLLNSKRLVYVLYNGAPVKETYLNESEVDSALNTLKIELESIGDKNEDEVAVDLTPYLKKVEANTIYATQTALIEGLAAKADITAIPDVTGFATQGEVATKAEKTYVDTELAKKANIADIPEIPEVPDISNLATKDELSAKADLNEVPTKTSELTNDSDFVTGTDLQGLGAQFSAQMQEMNTQNLKKIEASSIYATQTALTEGLATKADSTAIPDITGLATKTEVETKANINAIPTKTSQLTNDSDFTTGADLQSLGAEFGSQIQAMGTQNAQSFSNLEAKIPTKTSQLTNDSDFITSTAVGEAFQSFTEDIGKSFVTLDVFNAKIEEIQALIDGHHPQV